MGEQGSKAVTAGAEVVFGDGKKETFAMNPSLGLTSETAPWLAEVVGLMVQGDVVAVNLVDVPVERMRTD